MAKYNPAPSAQINTFIRPSFNFRDTAINFKGGAAETVAFADSASAPVNTFSSNFARPAPSPSPPVDQDRDFSQTNNQVSKVDEADLLKTDGTYIYTISNSVLSIILAYPANKATVMSKIDLSGKSPQAIFIEGNYLAVFGTEYVNDNNY